MANENPPYILTYMAIRHYIKGIDVPECAIFLKGNWKVFYHKNALNDWTGLLPSAYLPDL